MKFEGSLDKIWLYYMNEGVLGMTLEEYLNSDYVYKMTDLFIVLQFHDEQEMRRARIIQKTGYPRETVQTCLTRLVKEGILERKHPEAERYIYKRTDRALMFTDKQYSIVYYMYKKHVNLMRPNASLLVFNLLVYGSFEVDKLINERGYKRDPVYKALAKLKDAKIILRNGGKYYFTEEFNNKVLAYSQEPVTKTILQLYRENYKTIIGLAANAGGYQKCIDSLMLVLNLTEEQAREMVELKVADLIEIEDTI